MKLGHPVPDSNSIAGEEWIAASRAAVRAVVLGIKIRPAKRPLGTVLAKDRVLLGRQSLPPLFVGLGNVLRSRSWGLQSAMRTGCRQELTIVREGSHAIALGLS